MIFFKQDLYLGKQAGKDKGKIIRGIRKHKLQFGVYCLTLCVNKKDIFDIIPSYMLSQDSYKGRDITVIGLAVGRDEAMDLAGQMLLNACSSGALSGDDLRRYFE